MPSRVMGAIFIADHAASVEPPILVVPQFFEGTRVPPLAAEGPRKGAPNLAARLRVGRPRETGRRGLTAAVKRPGIRT